MAVVGTQMLVGRFAPNAKTTATSKMEPASSVRALLSGTMAVASPATVIARPANSETTNLTVPLAKVAAFFKTDPASPVPGLLFGVMVNAIPAPNIAPTANSKMAKLIALPADQDIACKVMAAANLSFNALPTARTVTAKDPALVVKAAIMCAMVAVLPIDCKLLGFVLSCASILLRTFVFNIE